MLNESNVVSNEGYGKIVVIKRTGQDSASFELIDDSYTFGRGVDCDIRIQLVNIAEQQCKISRNEHGQAVLIKMSEEGVCVNNCVMREDVRVLEHNDIITLVERSFRYEFTPEMLARVQLAASHQSDYAKGSIELKTETPKKISGLGGSVFSISEVPSSPATPKTPIPAMRTGSAGQSPRMVASPMGSAVVDNEITTSPKLSPKVFKLTDMSELTVSPFNIGAGASSLGMSVVSSTDGGSDCQFKCDKENVEMVFCEIDMTEKAEFDDAYCEAENAVCETATEAVIAEIVTEAVIAETSIDTETIVTGTEIIDTSTEATETVEIAEVTEVTETEGIDIVVEETSEVETHLVETATVDCAVVEAFEDVDNVVEAVVEAVVCNEVECPAEAVNTAESVVPETVANGMLHVPTEAIEATVEDCEMTDSAVETITEIESVIYREPVQMEESPATFETIEAVTEIVVAEPEVFESATATESVIVTESAVCEDVEMEIVQSVESTETVVDNVEAESTARETFEIVTEIVETVTETMICGIVETTETSTETVGTVIESNETVTESTEVSVQEPVESVVESETLTASEVVDEAELNAPVSETNTEVVMGISSENIVNVYNSEEATIEEAGCVSETVETVTEVAGEFVTETVEEVCTVVTEDNVVATNTVFGTHAVVETVVSEVSEIAFISETVIEEVTEPVIDEVTESVIEAETAQFIVENMTQEVATVADIPETIEITEAETTEVKTVESIEATEAVEFTPETPEATFEVAETTEVTPETTDIAEAETTDFNEIESVEATEAFDETTEATLETTYITEVEAVEVTPETLEVTCITEATSEIATETVEASTTEFEEIASVEIASVEIESVGTPKRSAPEEFETPMRKSTRVHLTPAALESVKKQKTLLASASPATTTKSTGGRQLRTRSNMQTEPVSPKGRSQKRSHANSENEEPVINIDNTPTYNNNKKKTDEDTPVRRSARSRVVNQK